MKPLPPPSKGIITRTKTHWELSTLEKVFICRVKHEDVPIGFDSKEAMLPYLYCAAEHFAGMWQHRSMEYTS